MCGKKPQVPQVVQRDPVAEQAQAEAKATADANTEIAARRGRRKQSSLLTGASSGAPAASAPTLLAQTYGKSTLGGK